MTAPAYILTPLGYFTAQEIEDADFLFYAEQRNNGSSAEKMLLNFPHMAAFEERYQSECRR